MNDAAYEHLVLKRYRHWTLFLHENQHYLGRAYAWLNRHKDMHRLSKITKAERDELFDTVLPEYERAVEKLSSPDFMNYPWLGNEFVSHGGHGHLHLIPRYQDPVLFAGRTFTDGRWGKNYAPYPKTKTPKAVVEKIRDALKKNLSKPTRRRAKRAEA